MEKIKSFIQETAQKADLKNNKTAKKILYVLAFVLVFAGGAYSSYLHLKSSIAASLPKPAVPVLAMKLTSENIDDFEELPGRTSAYRFAEIRPQVDGIIIKRFFTEGGEVKKGQQLYQIDPAPYQANYDSAKADLQKAEANLATTKAKNERFKKLIEIDAISKQEFDDIKATYAQANADVAIAKAALNKTKIYLDYTKVLAPISGRISKSLVTEGSLVSANQEQILTNITQLDPIYVDIERASEDLIDFKSKTSNQANTTVEVYLNDGSLYKQKGTLEFTEVNVDPSTSSVGIRALFDNPDETLLPGSFVKTRLKISNEDVVLVPQKATTRNQDGTLSVWIIDEQNKTRPVQVKPLKTIGNNWVIKDGLKDGDVIVLEGFQKIMPEAAVVPSFEEKKDK